MAIDGNYPQTIHIDRDIKNTYLDPIVNQVGSPLYRRDLSDAYFLAVAIGFRNNCRRPTNSSFDLRLYSTVSEDLKIFIRSVVLATNNFDFISLKDGKTTLKIIEEYANGGASILHDKIFSNNNKPIGEDLWEQLTKV